MFMCFKVHVLQVCSICGVLFELFRPVLFEIRFRFKVEKMTHRQRARRKKLLKTYRTIRMSPNETTTSNEQTVQPPTVIIKRYVSCSVQTDNELSHPRKKQFHINDLQSVNRISNLPIVESGWGYAENIYNKIKKSNHYVYWTLDQAEYSVHSVFEAAAPAITLLQGPIQSIDKLICKSLDTVEQIVPSINLPPEIIYCNTKKYVTDVGTKIARPVLKRADSVKQIGNSVLASKYTVFAADTLDGALDVAEKYVDKYLPATDDQTNYEIYRSIDDPSGKALHTMQHAKGFSRKLRRRLTQRTIAEMKALKHQSTEAVHVLVYVAELVAKDPKMAFQKGKELWITLSKDEPENQARPENLEQLIVMLTRETARRVVHLINYTSEALSKLPKKMSYSVNNLLIRLSYVTDSVVKTIHMEHVQQVLVSVLRLQGHHLAVALKKMNLQVNDYLDQVAQNLANSDDQLPKTALAIPQIKVQQVKATHSKMANFLTNSRSNVNGIENNS